MIEVKWEVPLPMAILEDGNVVETDIKGWAEWMGAKTGRQMLAQTVVGGVLVSTVFLGYDASGFHFYSNDTPLYFETMVFFDRGEGTFEPRYHFTTSDQALQFHWRQVTALMLQQVLEIKKSAKGSNEVMNAETAKRITTEVTPEGDAGQAAGAPVNWYARGSREVKARNPGYNLLAYHSPMGAAFARFSALHEPILVEKMWDVIIAAERWAAIDFGDDGEMEAAAEIVEALEELRPTLQVRLKDHFANE